MAVSTGWAHASYLCLSGKGGDYVNDHLAQLVLHVEPGTGTDAEEFDELTFQLGQELLELDVHSVGRPRQGPAPPGTRAGEILALGTLMVTVAKSAAALTALVGAVRSWLAVQPQGRVRVELDGDVLEVTGASASDQHQLIASWIARHATG
jgi:Effector Associated Constant Component 1